MNVTKWNEYNRWGGCCKMINRLDKMLCDRSQLDLFVLVGGAHLHY